MSRIVLPHVLRDGADVGCHEVAHVLGGGPQLRMPEQREHRVGREDRKLLVRVGLELPGHDAHALGDERLEAGVQLKRGRQDRGRGPAAEARLQIVHCDNPKRGHLQHMGNLEDTHHFRRVQRDLALVDVVQRRLEGRPAGLGQQARQVRAAGAAAVPALKLGKEEVRHALALRQHRPVHAVPALSEPELPVGERRVAPRALLRRRGAEVELEAPEV
mmetsp:Transcript_25898/g.80801  ORF Transcript_25898/g.80801 Transcript_25898/m.80801 type:complete len:217 (-) Transcript_25898:3-653(-)